MGEWAGFGEGKVPQQDDSIYLLLPAFLRCSSYAAAWIAEGVAE